MSQTRPSADGKLHLNREHALHLLHEMLRIRRFEERCAGLYKQEKICGFLHLYAIRQASRRFDDWLVCMASSQLHQVEPVFDEIIITKDADFAGSGVKAPSELSLMAPLSPRG